MGKASNTRSLGWVELYVDGKQRGLGDDCPPRHFKVERIQGLALTVARTSILICLRMVFKLERTGDVARAAGIQAPTT